MQNLIIFILVSIVVIMSIALMVKVNRMLEDSKTNEQNNEFPIFPGMEYMKNSATYKVEIYKILLELSTLKKEFESKSKEYGFENEEEFTEHILKNPMQSYLFKRKD